MAACPYSLGVLGQGSGESLGKLIFRTFDENGSGRINAQVSTHGSLRVLGALAGAPEGT